MGLSLLLNTIPLLKQYYSALDSEVEKREVRSALIHEVSLFYDQFMRPDSGLNQKYFSRGLCDGFLKKAEDVVLREGFEGFPGSKARLDPLAHAYMQEWEQLLLCLNASDEASLFKRVHSFVLSHQLFAKQFIQELKLQAPESHLGVQLTTPRTLRLFYSFTVDFLCTHPEHKDELLNLLQSSDPKIFLLIPQLAVLQLSKIPGFPCPELLQKFDREIKCLQAIYPLLDNQENQQIEKRLLNEEIPLSEKSNIFFQKITELAYRLNEKELAQPFSWCCRTLSAEFNTDIPLAARLQEELEDVEIYDTNESQLLYTFLQFPPQLLEEFYPIAPTLTTLESYRAEFSSADSAFKAEVKSYLLEGKQIEIHPEFMKISQVRSDLRQEAKLYRLCGIVQLCNQK